MAWRIGPANWTVALIECTFLTTSFLHMTTCPPARSHVKLCLGRVWSVRLQHVQARQHAPMGRSGMHMLSYFPLFSSLRGCCWPSRIDTAQLISSSMLFRWVYRSQLILSSMRMQLHLVFEVGPMSASNTLSGWAWEPGVERCIATLYRPDWSTSLCRARRAGCAITPCSVAPCFSLPLFLLRRHRRMASMNRTAEESIFRIIQTVLDAGSDL